MTIVVATVETGVVAGGAVMGVETAGEAVDAGVVETVEAVETVTSPRMTFHRRKRRSPSLSLMTDPDSTFGIKFQALLEYSRSAF